MKLREMTGEDRKTAWLWINYRSGKISGDFDRFFPFEILPVTGLMAIAPDGVPLAAAFLYLEKSSKVAVCGWCVANPENSPAVSSEAVDTVLKNMPRYAAQQGAAYLLSTFGNRAINRKLRKIGFTFGEKAENMFMKL